MPKSPAPDVAPAPTDELLSGASEVLSPDEVKALIAQAVQTRAAEIAAREAFEAEAAREAEERKDRQANPLAYVGLADINDAVSYVKLKHPLQQHERSVHLEGVTYEHIREDEDDVWVYRRA